MAEIPIENLLAAYEAEIGRLSGELLKTRVGAQVELQQLQQQLSEAQEKLSQTE